MPRFDDIMRRRGLPMARAGQRVLQSLSKGRLPPTARWTNKNNAPAAPRAHRYNTNNGDEIQ